MGWAVRIALGVLALAAGAELVLQVAARFVGDRAETSGGGRATIVCVGDSHTYGAAVAPEEASPSRLQVELYAAAPGTYRVINLGIPGHNFVVFQPFLDIENVVIHGSCKATKCFLSFNVSI